MTATIKRVQAAISKAGIPLEFVRGEGYHYFVLDDGQQYETESVMIPYTSDCAISQWVEEAEWAYGVIKARQLGE
jgi:hypothetical protein